MDGHRWNSVPKEHKLPWIYYLVVLALSASFWVIGPVAERLLVKDKAVDLPLSSLMTVCPITAALMVVQRESGWEGVKKLLRRAFDLKIKEKSWFIPIFFLMPTVMGLQYGLTNGVRAPTPDPQMSVPTALVFAAIFLVAAVGEEVGWQGYAIDRLQERWQALTASIVLGIAWAVWHIVPLIQLGRTPAQIVWQCIDMVATRILIVWLYNNTGKSVFAAVLYHAMYNVSTLLLPNYGLHYDPFANSILVVIAATIVTLLWGPKTLAQYRYGRAGMDARSKAGTA